MTKCIRVSDEAYDALRRAAGEAGLPVPALVEALFISALREHGLLVEVKKMLVGLRSDAGKYLVGDDTYYAIYMLRDEILRADPSGDAPVKKQLLWIL